MIYISTYNFNENGFFKFEENEFKTIFPETKRNVNAYATLDNDVILDDRGVSYLNSKIEIVSKKSFTINEYKVLRTFIEENGIFKITCDTGVFEVFGAVLVIIPGTRVKITANVSKLIRA